MKLIKSSYKINSETLFDNIQLSFNSLHQQKDDIKAIISRNIILYKKKKFNNLKNVRFEFRSNIF